MVDHGQINVKEPAKNCQGNGIALSGGDGVDPGVRHGPAGGGLASFPDPAPYVQACQAASDQQNTGWFGNGHG